MKYQKMQDKIQEMIYSDEQAALKDKIAKNR
jgi:hypothetical protein